MLGTLKKIFAFAGNRKGLLKKSLFFSLLNGIFASLQFGALYFIVDVRCVDVAEHLSVTKPSVSRAVKELTKMKYLVKKADGTLSLTEQGQNIAEQVYEKHLFFTNRLIEMGVSPDIAAQDACKLEHVISEESFLKLKAMAEE